MQQGSGMLIGQKGVKYGLILPGKGGSSSAKPGGTAPAGARKPASGAGQKLAAFGGDSDSEGEDVGTQVARQAAKKHSDAKVQDMYAAALADDPTAFDYDAVYDDMQAQKAIPQRQERLDRRPKYIATLLEQAQVKKREEDIAFERRQLKERSKEDHLYGETERFVTAAYKRKLEEDKLWQEEQKKREAEEAANEVTKIGHMGNFYKNLFKANVAFGAPAEATAAARSSKDAGAAPPPATEPAAAASRGGADRDGRERQEHIASHDAAGAASSDEAGTAAGSSRARDHGRLRHDSPVDPEPEQRTQQQATGISGRLASDQQRSAGEPGTSSRAAASEDIATAQPGGAETAAEGAEVEAMQAQPAHVSGKRRNTEDAVAAARERYLARKQRLK